MIPRLRPQLGSFEGLAQGLKNLPQQDTSAWRRAAGVRVERENASREERRSEGAVGSLTDRTSRPELSLREFARGRFVLVDPGGAVHDERAPLRSAESLGRLKRRRRRRGRSGHGTDESGSDHHRTSLRCESFAS